MEGNRSLVYLETLNKEEKTFLLKQALVSKKSYLRTSYYIALFMAVVFMFVFTIANFTYDPLTIPEEVETPLSPLFVLQIALYFYIVASLVFGFFYYTAIHSLFKEIKSGKKAIASVKIKQKQYMEQNNTYHLHLLQFFKKSIQVEKSFFEIVEVNDEINVEYMPSSERIMGYH